ncbi:MAG: putative carbohydrate kinase [Bryobacterales bacterium]|nr:putative carbohydrate kinase [Bryobacterales bacterium]
MFDCVVAGEANIDLLVDGVLELEVGKEKLADDCSVVLGGSSSITAFNLSKLGASVKFIGVLGRDIFGNYVRDKLVSAGVDVSAMRWSDTTKSGITIWHSHHKQRAGVTYSGTIAQLRASDITDESMRNARHLHVGAYYLLRDFHRDAPSVFAAAKAAGLSTSLDCNYDPSESWDSNIWNVLPHTDVFFPNEKEATELTGREDPREAARDLARYARTVVVKLGADGAFVVTPEESFHQPAIPSKVVDTTGAGDSFNAGYLAKLLQGGSIQECAQAGAEAGARCVRMIGGTAAFEDGR